MRQPTNQRVETLRARFQAVGQEHVFTFWNEISDAERRQLLDDLTCVNVSELPALGRLAVATPADHGETASLEPVEVIHADSAGQDARERGRSLIAAGKIAAFTVAGGQGTRLGFEGPKGAFQISPVKNKPLFQLFAEAILATDRRYQCRSQWYIMTSPANDQQTQTFFRQHSYFGMSPDHVTFFQQGVMPAFDRDGKILLDQKHRLALSPDGHGGSLLALARTGMLADMAQRGIEHVSYFQVDNPLVSCLDPVFIGLHHLHRSEMSSKALPKADDFERVGNFALAAGKLTVIEYSDLPDELARAKNQDGSRRFDAGNIAVHLLSRTFVERLTADPAAFALPWHRALKKVPYIDPTTGSRIEPTEPNAIKLESFVFDALPLAANPIVVQTSRAQEFSPVKNPTGVDSVQTARRDLNRRAADWLQSAGFDIPRQASGEPNGTFEISPLLALDAAQLAEQGPTPEPIKPGTTHYFD
ncbi:MAG: UDPGP type 1 family protein [Phycisphaerae bacterium]|nr:UDPGP type 1 family protein [Phycisphaerae bacterium]